MSSGRGPDDRALVDAFLERYQSYSGQEIEGMVEGVTSQDVSRWRRDDWSYLTGAKRRALEAALEPGGGDAGGGEVGARVDRITFALGQVAGWLRWAATAPDGAVPEWAEAAVAELRDRLAQDQTDAG